MVEKALDIVTNVERHILMHCPGAETPLGNGGRSHGSSRQKDCQATIAKPLQQRQDGIGFADAGSMGPDQRAVRAFLAGFAETFLAARRILLTAARPAIQKRLDEWLQLVPDRPVEADPGLADPHVSVRPLQAPRPGPGRH